MQFLRTAATNKLHREIAQKIYELGLKTKIEFVNTLPKGRLAEYDPKTDTIYVTSEGLKDEVLLHEVTHAATVSVIDAYYNKYLKGQKSGLTQAAFAELIETPVATLRDWEQGRFAPPGGVLCLLRLIIKHPELYQELSAA